MNEASDGPLRGSGQSCIRLNLDWTGQLPFRGNVVSHTLDAVGEELAFLQLKGHRMFLKDVADAFKQLEERGNKSRP
jgi:hypothetical protein